MGRWVSNQRDRYKARNKEGGKSTMTEDEIEQLEAVGFDWDPYGVWELWEY